MDGLTGLQAIAVTAEPSVAMAPPKTPQVKRPANVVRRGTHWFWALASALAPASACAEAETPRCAEPWPLACPLALAEPCMPRAVAAVAPEPDASAATLRPLPADGMLVAAARRVALAAAS